MADLDPATLIPKEARARFRAGLSVPTSGWSAGWTQGNTEDLDVVGTDALVGEQAADGAFSDQLSLVVAGQNGELPAVMAEWRGAVDCWPGRIAVEAQPVDVRPLTQHLRVDDDPAVLVGASLETDAQSRSGGAGAAIGRDHVRGSKPGGHASNQVEDLELDALIVLVVVDDLRLGWSSPVDWSRGRVWVLLSRGPCGSPIPIFGGRRTSR